MHVSMGTHMNLREDACTRQGWISPKKQLSLLFNFFFKLQPGVPNVIQLIIQELPGHAPLHYFDN